MPDAAPQCKQMQRKRRDGAGVGMAQGAGGGMAGALAVAIALCVTPGLVPGVQGPVYSGGAVVN